MAWEACVVRVGICLGLVFLTGFGLAQAQEAATKPEEGSAAYKACLDKAQTTVDLVDCQTQEMKVQDRDLNAVYKKAMAALPADQQAKLRLAQRAWLDFRQRDCDVFYGRETGTIAAIEAGSCMVRHTARRVADLQDLAIER
jgi:uncharacterized protein YecT (DUF1311 family)